MSGVIFECQTIDGQRLQEGHTFSLWSLIIVSHSSTIRGLGFCWAIACVSAASGGSLKRWPLFCSQIICMPSGRYQAGMLTTHVGVMDQERIHKTMADHKRSGGGHLVCPKKGRSSWSLAAEILGAHHRIGRGLRTAF